MGDEYRLSAWQARVCRLFPAAFLVVAAVQASAIGLALVAPNLLAIEILCDGSGCGISGNPQLLLPDDVRGEVEASASAGARFAAHLDEPATRLKLMATGAVGTLPILALLLFIAAALRTLGRRGSDDLARAIPWLRRASIAALLAVPLVPLGESLRTTVLLAAVVPEPHFSLYIDVNRFVLSLLLAFAAFAVTWALAAGGRAGRDLAEIV
jgi:hypothetical protein